MKLEEKINQIGRILADIQLEIHLIKRNQNEIKEFMLKPNKIRAMKFMRNTNKEK